MNQFVFIFFLHSFIPESIIMSIVRWFGAKWMLQAFWREVIACKLLTLDYCMQPANSLQNNWLCYVESIHMKRRCSFSLFLVSWKVSSCLKSSSRELIQWTMIASLYIKMLCEKEKILSRWLCVFHTEIVRLSQCYFIRSTIRMVFLRFGFANQFYRIIFT